MTQDELEFAISQYADDEHSVAERHAVERLLETDGAALELLTEHRMLTAALRAAPLPPVSWDALTTQINQRIDAVEPALADVLGRIDPGIAAAMEVRSARPAASRWGGRARWALAASVMLAVGVGMGAYLGGMGSGHLTQAPIAAAPGIKAPIAVATVPPADTIDAVATQGGAPETDIVIGPSANSANTPSVARYGDLVSPSKSHIWISSTSGAPATRPADDDLFQPR